MFKFLLDLFGQKGQSVQPTRRHAELSPDEIASDRRLLQESGAIVDQVVALDLQREPVVGQPILQHDAIFAKMKPQIARLQTFGAYIIPKVIHDLSDAKDDRVRKTYLRLLCSLDPSGFGLQLMLSGFNHRNPLVRQFSSYGTAQILSSLTEASITAAGAALGKASQREITDALARLSRDPSEHPRLREMTRDALTRANRHGLGRE